MVHRMRVPHLPAAPWCSVMKSSKAEHRATYGSQEKKEHPKKNSQAGPVATGGTMRPRLIWV